MKDPEFVFQCPYTGVKSTSFTACLLRYRASNALWTKGQCYYHQIECEGCDHGAEIWSEHKHEINGHRWPVFPGKKEEGMSSGNGKNGKQVQQHESNEHTEEKERLFVVLSTEKEVIAVVKSDQIGEFIDSGKAPAGSIIIECTVEKTATVKTKFVIVYEDAA